MMKYSLSTAFLLLICFFVKGQSIDANWYSEATHHGIIIQNSFPKGGPYTGKTNGNYNHSYLVFFTRVHNASEKPVELRLHFSADAIAIPHSPDTYVKLFLPLDSMTLDKRDLLSYGLTEVASLEQASSFERKLAPQEDCLFYVVVFFYQTKAEAWKQERGGNRAELVLDGQALFYNMLPQVDSLPCGHILFNP